MRIARTAILIVAVSLSCKGRTPAGQGQKATAGSDKGAAGFAPRGCTDPRSAPAGSVTFSGDGDAASPALAAMAGDWLVAWIDDAADGSRILVSTEKAAAAGTAAQVLSSAADAWGVRLAGSPGGGMAVWIQGGDQRAVMARAVGADGTPAGEPVSVSGKGGAIGPPDVAAVDGDYVVTWVEGSDVHAALVEPDATIARRTSWPGGNLRPGGPIGGPASGERAGAMPERPRLIRSTKGLEALWWGEHWFSDDQSGQAQYRRLVQFPDAGGEPVAQERDMPVWGRIAAIARAPGDAGDAVLYALHDPNGGPWELVVRLPGGDADGVVLTSEPAGPLWADALAVGDQLVVTWPSPTYGGITSVTVGPDGKPTAAPKVVSTGASEDAASIALAHDGNRARLAYVACNGSKPLVVRTAAPGDGEAASAVPREQTVVETLPRKIANRMLDYDLAAIPTAGETWLVTVGTAYPDDGLRPEAHVAGQDGQLRTDPHTLDHGDRPRCDDVAVASHGEFVAAAFGCCDDSSMCQSYDVRVVELGQPTPRVSALATDADYSGPVLAIAEGKVALVALKGGWGARQIIARVVPAGAEVGARLASAPDQPVAVGGGLSGLSAAWSSAGLVVAYREQQGRSYVLRLAVLPEKGSARPGVTIAEAGDGSWGAHRLVGLADGVALLANIEQRGETHAVLHLLTSDASVVVRRTTVFRGEAEWPYLAQAGGVIGATWYSQRSDGVYAALVANDGTRLASPVRLDVPEMRASRDAPKIAASGTAGKWRVFWNENSVVFSTELAFP